MRYQFRPLPVWPHGETNGRRQGQFRVNGRWVDGEWKPGKGRAGWDQTLRDLEREVEMLGGDDVLIGVGLEARDIRLDGRPRADARAMSHPGVEVSFDSRYGRLTYATDVFTDWQDNLRAVAKGLEALRAIDRWGVAKRGEQYAGFAMLTAGPGQEELGKTIVEQYGSVASALRATHPDTGNGKHTTREFQAVMAYRESQAVRA